MKDKLNCPNCGGVAIKDKYHPHSSLYYCSKCDRYHNIIEVKLQERPKCKACSVHGVCDCNDHD